jgi:uncharacterized membrane protein YozB (DUF420 family)
MGLGLVLGALFARLQRFRAHALCQSVIVLFNLVLILLTMVPSFLNRVAPGLPEKLHKSYYALATIHGLLGGIAEFGGLYLLLAAGTNVLPMWLRITRFKPWMRCVLALWWVVLLLGFGTYARWYVARR